jgi:tetratricopeptide (TPR) repeat protein
MSIESTSPEVVASEPTPSEAGVQEREKREKMSERFKIFVAIMIAVVTVVSALIAWRSALAAVDAGNFDDAGILAALNREEANTIASIDSSQARAAYISYRRNVLLAEELIPQDGNIASLTEDEARQFREAIELATASRQFFSTQYVDENSMYDYERQIGQALAQAAREKDLEPDRHFAAANQSREKSVGFVATLLLMGISLLLFAIAETIGHVVKFALALGGMAFLLIGSGAALGIEMGGSLPNIYSISSLASYIVGGLVVLGILALLVMSRGRPAQAADPDEDPREERFKQIVTITIGSVALLAAVVAYLQADAGAIGDGAIRKAQGLAAQALGTETTGEALVNFESGAVWQAWEEMDTLSRAYVATGDEKNATRYGNVRDTLAGLSKLLSPPYFDPEKDSSPKVEHFETDTYIAKKAELSERSAAEAAIENAWEEKSNSYIVHLTLLAAALALLGLSLTFSGKVRPLFVGVASLLVAATIAWGLSVYTKPVDVLPDSAAVAYGRGVGLAYQGDHKEAIGAFDEALKASPQYKNALYERANSKMDMADYAAAARDYEAAKAAGKNDPNTGFSLGFAYYLMGRFDDAERAYRQVLATSPDHVGVRLDLARTELAAGKIEAAKADYKLGMDSVTQQIAAARGAKKEPPPELYIYLDYAGLELEGLLDTLSDYNLDWTTAPPKEAIQNPEALKPVAEEIKDQLKSLLTALEFTGQQPAGTVAAEISSLQFALPSQADPNQPDTTTISPNPAFPMGPNKVFALYNYEGLQDGQKVIWKVYRNGQELTEYRTIVTWDAGESGEAMQAFSEGVGNSNAYALAAGDYAVEMYVDSHFVQNGYFSIEGEEQ